MMSPRLPLDLLTHARRARRLRLPAMAAIAACAASIAVATAASPASAAEAGSVRAASAAWNPFFEQLRPVATVDARRVVVLFDDPSLGEWSSAGDRLLTPAQERAWVKRALALQQRRLDALSLAGVQFAVEHRYVRVANGASLVVHGDNAQLLRSMRSVASVTPVRTIWPAAAAGGAATDDGAAGAAGAAGVLAADAPRTGSVRVAVLDTGIEASHPAVAGHVATPFDATVPRDRAGAAAGSIEPDAHGTAVAGAVLRGAGEDVDVQLLPVQVLAQRPARDGVETVLGDSDDLLAGLEHAVDPDGNGDTTDAAHVAVVAASAPYAAFTGSPEDVAVQAADALGTVVVAAAGNDGASGDSVGTIGSVAASTAALAIGAADLRGHTPAVDVRVHGSGIDETFAGAPRLTTGDSAVPEGSLAVVAIDEPGGEASDYLDAELRSRVSGAVALVAAREGVTIAAQVRAAADAGAIAVLVGADGADAAAGTIDVPGADVPAIGLERADARALRDALASGERIALTLRSTTEANPGHGTVAGFSSAGPRLDGAGRPDALAPGVGMVVAGPDGSWHVASGTSIAAGWAAGQVASVREAQPDWDAATVRASLLGTAIPLGSVGDRPAVASQGAGLLDAARAAQADALLDGGRIDFGSVAPGSSVRRALDLDVRDLAGLRILVDDGGAGNPVAPSLAGDALALDVPAKAEEGHVGGWLVLPDLGLRIPWSATIRDVEASRTAIRADLTSRTLAPVAGPGAFASTLSLAIGGNGGGEDALGLAAVQRLEVRIVDAKGRDRGSIGGLDQALPGIYTFGLTGVDPRGKRLAAGEWTLQVRYVPASDPDGKWREGPATTVVVERAKRAR